MYESRAAYSQGTAVYRRRIFVARGMLRTEEGRCGGTVVLQERRGEHDLHCVQVSVGHRNGYENFPRLPDAAAKAIFILPKVGR